MRSIFVLLIAVLLLVGCGDPKNTVIPQDISKWDAEFFESTKDLPKEDRDALIDYFARVQLGEVFGDAGIPAGITVGQAIEDQKKWKAELAAKEAEEKALKEKLERERAEIRKAMSEYLTVAVIEIYTLKEDWQNRIFHDQQVIKLGVKNKGGKDIMGIKGAIRFTDMFDKEVGSFGFAYEDGVRAGEIKAWTEERYYDRLSHEQRAIASLQEGKYRSVFEPAMIVFSDGSKLALPE